MALVSRPWGHVIAQLVGLAVIALAVALLAGGAWGLLAAGIGILAVGVAAERGQLERRAGDAG